MTDALISAQHVGVRRGGRDILQHADLVLERGKITTLIGPNGAGKTTLVRVILGLVKPDTGSLTRQKGLRIGYMPQKLHIDPSLPLSARRFLALAGKPRMDLDEVIGLTGIGGLLHSPMSELSGGETQRVLLARALLRDPQLLVLDEPVQGVDITGQEALYKLINDIRRARHCGVLLVSHDLHLVMANTDTVVCLNQHICCQGHPQDVTAHPAYLDLFGSKVKPQVALYTHRHDHVHAPVHRHDEHGHIISEDESQDA